MRRKILAGWLAWLMAIAAYGQEQEIHILAVNDMHGAIEAFPQLTAIADSLRTLYPSLLVLSAGDNRTGNSVSDLYGISSYPMVALMNQAGFDATTLGNHEFDVKSLPPLLGLSHFSYICANIHPSEESGIRVRPTQVFDAGGIKVGVIGVIQVNRQGRPDTHPANVHGIWFSDPLTTVGRYKDFSDECDVTVLLSHIGYNADIRMAEHYPWLDVIIGGHTHTQLTADEPLHNGVLITQNKDKLPKATHITLTLKDRCVRSKKAEYIDVKSHSRKASLVEAMIAHFSENPFFKQVAGYAEGPFKTRDQITFMMCDALLAETGADISIINNGNVRIDSLQAGEITMKDILSIDPFYNEAIEMMLTGKDILKILTSYSRGSLYRLPRVGGIVCEATVDKKDPHKDRLKDIRLKTLDGQDFKLNRTYRVITSSYVSSIVSPFVNCTPRPLNIETSKILANFLRKQEKVNYQDVNRLFVTEK